MADYKADLVFWKPATTKELEARIQEGSDVWTGKSKQQFSNITDAIMKLQRKCTNMVVVGTGSTQVEFDPPRGVYNDGPAPFAGASKDKESDKEIREAIETGNSDRRI